MYHYITDKAFLKKLNSLCCDIINQLVQRINRDSIMEVKAHLVGSGAKNLVTQNASSPIDLDFNLEIIDCFKHDITDGRSIKEYIRKQFNIVLNRNDWGDCHDSTSALTTEERVFTQGNKTPFSIDLAIVTRSRDGWFRLIHDKTGYVASDRYFWNPAPNSRGLSDRANAIKKQGAWLILRETYLQKKNMYLSRNDRNHPSFIVYIEAVNEVYNKYCR